MTPKSDYEDDMSMEEILASIRKFVTDNPAEEPQKQPQKQKVYQGDLSESLIIPPAGHVLKKDTKEDQVPQAAYRPLPVPPSYESDILELKNPINSDPLESSNKMAEKMANRMGDPFSTKSFLEQNDSLSSARTQAASANSLSRLAQISKIANPKAQNLAHQRDLTLDQLIQDLIRPLIKQWMDAHLSSLVEEMVAKEIKRITKHLE